MLVLLSKSNGLGNAPDLPDLRDLPDPDRLSSTAAWDPLATRAEGQDDGSYTKLLQIMFLK